MIKAPQSFEDWNAPSFMETLAVVSAVILLSPLMLAVQIYRLIPRRPRHADKVPSTPFAHGDDACGQEYDHDGLPVTFD